MLKETIFQETNENKENEEMQEKVEPAELPKSTNMRAARVSPKPD